MFVRLPVSRRIVFGASHRCFSTSRQRQASYGFIGLGQMGYQMAKNLQSKLQPTDTVTLYDVNTKAMERLAAEIDSTRHRTGATVHLAKDALELRDLDTVVTALPEPQHVATLFSRFTGLPFTSSSPSPPSSPPPDTAARDAPLPGTLFIDCSTIDPHTSRRCAQMVSSSSALRADSAMVDAPMSGGVVGAAAGTLTFMLGASPGTALARRAEAVLRMMGSRVLCCGSTAAAASDDATNNPAHGSGLAAKLANNYLLAVQNVGVAEAMALGTRLGVEASVLASVINASTGRCWSSEVNNPVPGVVAASPAGRGYEGGFGIALMRKDLGLAWKAGLGLSEGGKDGGGLDMEARMRLGAEAARVYEAAEREERCKGRDFSVVWRWVADEGGEGCDGGTAEGR